MMKFPKSRSESSDFNRAFYGHDWAATPVGPRDTWSLHLSMAVQGMLDTVQPMFILWGERNHILFNAAYAERLGSQWIDHLGGSLPKLFAPIWPSIEPYVSAAHAGQGSLAENVPFKSPASGFAETGYYTFSFTPFCEQDGKILGATVICIETTAKVEARARIRTERNLAFRLFEEAPGFVAILEGEDHRFVFANTAYLKMVDRQVVGLTVDEALPEMRDQEILAILEEVFRTGRRYVAEERPVQFQKENGAGCDQRYLTFVYEPMRNEDGSIRGIFVEGHDVTQKVLAEEKVQRLLSELIHANRLSAMGAMAATLAHELNQPLTAIGNYLGASRLVLQTGGDLSALGDALGAASENTRKVGQMIQSVRDFTRRGEVKQDRVALAEVLREAAGLAETGSCDGVKLSCSIAGDMIVVGDAIQIQQVILNLARNACEAAHEVSPKHVVISLDVVDGMAKVSVDDNGTGIAPDKLGSVFEAFQSTKDEGMGIGLAISRTIVEAHQGTIWAENKRGGGARFCFTLPLAA